MQLEDQPMQLSDHERSRRYELVEHLLAVRGAPRLVLTAAPHDRARVSFLAGIPVSTSAGVVAFSPDHPATLLVTAFDERPQTTGWLEIADLEKPPAHLADLELARPAGDAGSVTELRVPADGVGAELDELRAVKSPEELRAVEESGWILDAVFEHLLDCTEPGRPVRQVAAQLHQRGLELGAVALRTRIHRSIPHGPASDSIMVLSSDAPDDAVIRVGSPLNISVALAGPTGYWTRLTRTIALGQLELADEAAARAASAALAAICRHLKPGRPASEAMRIAQLAAADEGGWIQKISIAGTGLAPSEPPSLQSPDASPATGNVVAVQVQASSADGSAVSLQTDTLIIEREVARRLTRLPIGVLHTLHRTQMGRTGDG